MLEGLALFQLRGFWTALPALWLAPLLFLLGAGLLLGVTEIAATAGSPDHPDEAAIGAVAPLCPAASWLLLPIALIFFLSLRQPVFTERYLIWIGPATLLTLALGIRVLARSSGRWGIVLAAVAIVYVLGALGLCELATEERDDQI